MAGLLVRRCGLVFHHHLFIYLALNCFHPAPLAVYVVKAESGAPGGQPVSEKEPTTDCHVGVVPELF